MASKETAIESLTGPRILERTVDEYIGTFDSASNKFPAYKGWVTSAAGGVLMHESYFDLGGYEREFLTLFPTNATLQDPGYYTSSATDVSTNMVVLDIISQERLSIVNVEADWRNNRNVPNMPTTTEDFEQIIFGQFRWMAPSTSFSFTTALTPISRGNFGSANPTTVQKLWCYRFLIYENDPGFIDVNLECAATRFVLGATIAKEEDLPFLMRQYRSYELASVS